MKHLIIKTIFAFFLFFISASSIQGQEKSRNIHLFIDSVFSRNDSLLLILDGGSYAGLEKGKKGSIHARYLKEFEKVKIDELGSGHVIQVSSSKSIFYAGRQINHDVRKIMKWDLVKLDIQPPGAGKIFTELAARGIILSNADRVPFYDITKMSQQGAEFKDDSLIKLMISDVKNTAEILQPITDSTNVLVIPLNKGRYTGRSVIEVMENITPADVNDFLSFVRSYPGKYMGYVYKFNETFATWVLNNAPYSSFEMLAAWKKNKDPKAELQKWYKNFAPIIRSEKLTLIFYDEAITYNKEGKRDSALLKISSGLDIAFAVNDTIGKAALWQAKAQIYQDEEKYAQAIACTDSTIKYATIAKSTEYLFSGYFKKAFCLYKINSFANGREILAEAENAINKYRHLFKEIDTLDIWRKRFEYEGWIDYSSGNYNSALINLNKGININNQLQTEASMSNTANDYLYIGNIYKSQGAYDKALQVYDSAYQIYKILNDTYYLAYTQNYIGHVYYKIGKYPLSIEQHTEAYHSHLRMEKWDDAGYSKSMLGSNLEMENKIEQSIIAHREAIELRKRADNKDGQAFSWKKLGELYERTGQKKEALLAYDTAAYFYAAIGDSAQQAQNFLNVGKVYENDKDFRKARTYYEKGAVILKRLQSKSGYIEALEKLGSVTFVDDPEASEKFYAECLQESSLQNDIVNQLYSMINLGILAGTKKNFAVANTWFEKALPLSLASKDPSMEAYCYRNMASLATMNLKAKEAFSYYHKAASIYDTLDKARYFGTQVEIANLYISHGNFDSAAILNKQIIAEAAKLGYFLQHGDALINLSFLYQLQSLYKEGMALADSAEIIYTQTGNTNRLANVLTTKAGQYRGLGMFNESVKYYQKADSIYLSEKNDWSRSTVANNTGVTFFHQGDYREAINYFEKSLKLNPAELIDESYLLAKSNIAECYAFLNVYDSAMIILEALYPKAKEQQFVRMSSSMAMLMGRIFVIQGDHEKALPFLLEARNNSVSEKAGIPYRQTESLMYLGIVTEKSDPENALQYLQQATEIARKFQVETVGWEAFFELGEFYYKRNDYSKAIAAYKEAVEMIDAKSTNVYGGDEAKKIYQNSGKKPVLYARLISSLSATGAVEEAWAFAQKTQQEAIKDLMGNLSTNANDADKASAIQKLLDLQQKRSGIEQNIKKIQEEGSEAKTAQLKVLQNTRNILEKEYLNYVTDLVKTYPDIDGYFSKNVNPEDFKDIKESIPDDMVVVLYLLNGKQLLIFTATNKKIGVAEQMLDEEMEPLIDKYIHALSNPALAVNATPLNLRSKIKKKTTAPVDQKVFMNMSQQLYNLLVAPIENEIKQYKSLCIIPNGRLSNLPFQCIANKTGDGSTRFLVEDFNVFYTNKLTLFLKAGRKDRDLASFTGFGNPDKSLPSAGIEVEAIGKILNTTSIFLQDNATESKAKTSLENSKYLHFATHGVLNYSDFSSSYLKMSDLNSDSEDGELRIDEIKTLNISGCELVTLSACETAVNQELKKGWYISPANAFLVSSVRSVVASLWAVDDDATNLLMQAFYKNLTLMDKAEALRKAQETLSKMPGYQHPFYWGAFVLYGDWR